MSEFFTEQNLDLRPIMISRTQARQDFRLYQRLRAEAIARGTELQIVEDAEYNARMGIETPTPRPLEIDNDGLAEDEAGRKFVPIRKESEARNLREYERLRARALALGVEWRVISDRDLPPLPPEAA